MPPIDREAPLRFLRTAFEPDDCVAVFLKSYETGRVSQRVGPLSWVMHPKFQAWLRFKNAQRFNVYVSVNAIAPGRRSRTREAIGAIRHVFLEADHDGAATLARIRMRTDLPEPSYLLHSSPNRVHIFWRATGFEPDQVEALQKQLARELDTDSAATAATQTTRIPGFFNHKRAPAPLIRIEYCWLTRMYGPAEFPQVQWIPRSMSIPDPRASVASGLSSVERARRYLARVPPAVAGEHGDVHTFRVCCRLARGFALDDTVALELLEDWNARCTPPWSERDLLDKLRRAKRYGDEPIAGLLQPSLRPAAE